MLTNVLPLAELTAVALMRLVAAAPIRFSIKRKGVPKNGEGFVWVEPADPDQPLVRASLAARRADAYFQARISRPGPRRSMTSSITCSATAISDYIRCLF
jgi:hypothetical protein